MTPARQLAAVPNQPERRTRWTDAELMATEFPPPKWAVPGLLCEGLNLLAGAPKLGKSWLSLGLGAAIANGNPPSARSTWNADRSSTAPWKTPAVGCSGDGAR